MTKNLFEKSNKKSIVFTVLLFLVFAALAFLFPDSGDDWAWGSQLGIDRLKSNFDNYNGRWAGNLLVMLLTRSKLLDVIFTAASLVCVCAMPKLFSNTKSFASYAFGFFLLLLLPKEIMVQSVVWTAGLSNYLPPIVLTFLYFLLIKNIFESDVPTYTCGVGILAFFIAFVSALFMENVTLYNIAISVLILGFTLIKYKKIYLTHIAHFVGSVLGAVLMFSNSAYSAIAKGEDSYRSTAKYAELVETVREHTKTIFQQCFLKNMATLLILSILCVIVYILFAAKCRSKCRKNMGLIATAVNVFTFFIIFLKKQFPEWALFVGSANSAHLTIWAFAGIAVIYYGSVLATVLLCITQHAYKWKALLLLGSIPILIAPLAIVDPIGPRCFFPPFFMLIAACVVLFVYMEKEIGMSLAVKKGVVCSFLAVGLAALVFLFNIYGVIYRYDSKRNEYVKKQVDAGYQTVMMTTLPYPSFVWVSEPAGDLWGGRYKSFHGIDNAVEFEFIDNNAFDKWTKEFDKEIDK
mgnify:CR=1 FL=1